MPELQTNPPLLAELIPLIDREGRSVLVVVAKCTFRLLPAGALQVSEVQDAVRFVDAYIGDPSEGLFVIPADLTDLKPSGEIIVIGPSSAAGLESFSGREVAVACDELEFSGQVDKSWPFGPVPRVAPSRRKHAGTYDADWQKNRMPLLPVDFDPRYNLAAPEQQVGAHYFTGDETLTIVGLYEEGRAVSCRLPGRTVLVSGNVGQRYFSKVAALDTILIWSEEPRITLVWRQVIQPRRKIEEVGTVSTLFIRAHTARELYGNR